MFKRVSGSNRRNQMTTETQINAATLRNLTDDEFIRMFQDSDDPLLVEAINRLKQQPVGVRHPRQPSVDAHY